MKKIMVCMSVLLCTVIVWATAVHAQGGGAFSTYLVGTYDLRDTHTVFQIVNPTAGKLEVYIVFFDDAERPLKCVKEKLTRNDLLEVDVRKVEPGAKFGVAKIVSLRDKKPYFGIVGFQRNYFETKAFSETNLASVPGKILDEEMRILMEICK